MRPNYYKVRVKCSDGGTHEVECFDLIDALGLDFYTGNVLKYLFRCGRKLGQSRLDELAKVKTYATRAHRMEEKAVSERTKIPQPESK